MTSGFRRLAAILALALGTLLAVAGCESSTTSGAVHRVPVDGQVGPVMEQFIDRALDRAEDNNAKLVVLELDTPGGFSSSMREIVQRIQGATVPVAVFVSPSGARAGSAGTFITMAGNIAAMAPGTNIGAASAINSDGTDIEGALGRKIENDAVAFIRSIAELRGRNADWAEDAVRDAIAASANEAVELNVVDFVANDFDDLLAMSEGRTVELRPGVTATLQELKAAPVVTTEMTIWERVLEFLANPTIASLLISLGFLGLIIEMASPGIFVPGVAGAISMTLGFLGFGVLPVDAVGLVLIALGLVLIALEFFLPGGILGVGGAIALVLGGFIAFRDTPGELRPPVWLILALFGTIALIVASLALTIRLIRGLNDASGAAELIGKIAVARTALTPDGTVFIGGERWQARVEDGTSVSEGARLRIMGHKGPRLWVKPETRDEVRPQTP